MRMAIAPEASLAGQIIGYAAVPEAWVALGAKAGVSAVKACGLAGTRTFGQVDETGDVSGAIGETLAIAGTQYVLSGIFSKFHKIKKRNGEEVTAEDADGQHIMSEKIIKEGKASEAGQKGKASVGSMANEASPPKPESIA